MAVQPGVNIASFAASVPPAVGGWNARDPLDGMDPKDAVVIDNLFPQPAKVELRNGYSTHGTGLEGAVQTLVEFREQDGTANLIGVANNKIWNATSAGAASDITNSMTITVDKWQTLVFRNTLLMVNGTDTGLQLNASLTASTYTVTGVNTNTINDITSFKNRVYLADDTSLWYGAIDTVGGTHTEFDVSSLFRRGGSIQWISSWTRDSGAGSQDLLVVCSTMGEVLAYQGTDPGNANWALFGRFFLPIPLGVRSKVEFGSDLLIVTEQGVIPLSTALQGNEELTTQTGAITDKIQDAFRSVALTKGGNFGWEGILYPAGNYLLINVPVDENTTSHQYVMNTLTGSWCRFIGQDSATWALLSEDIYFGDHVGNVYRADFGSDDNNATINASLKQAFNFFDDRILEKKFNLARPLITTDNSLLFNFGIDVDFEDTTITDEAITTGELGIDWGDNWDSGPWAGGSIFSKEWRSITGIGRAASIKLSGQFKGVNFSISGFNVVYEPGGIL